MQTHHPMDTHSAGSKGGLRLTGDDGGELVHARLVRHIQMLALFRQEADNGEGASFCHTIHGDDGKLHRVPDGFAELQNLQRGGLQCDLAGVLREPSGGVGEAEQLYTDGVVIAQVQTASLHGAGHIGVTQLIEGTQLHELLVVHNFVVQHHHIRDTDFLLPVMELGLDDAIDTEDEGRDQEYGQKYADGQTQIAPLIGFQPGGGHARIGQHLHHATPLSCSI